MGGEAPPGRRFLVLLADINPTQTVAHIAKSGHSSLQIGMDLPFAAAIVFVTQTYSRQLQVPAGCNGAVPGFAESLWLHEYPVNAIGSKAASHIQEESMTNLWSNAQVIEQVLLWILR